MSEAPNSQPVVQTTLNQAGDDSTTVPTDPRSEDEKAPVAPGRRVSEVYPGDVLYFARQGYHGHVQPAAGADDKEASDWVDIYWLDGYSPGLRTREVRRENLSALADRGMALVVAEGVEDATKRWAISDGIPRSPEEGAPQRAVQPAPRRSVDQLLFSRESSQAVVNGFLEHPLIDHKRGGVTFQRAMFGAWTPQGRLSAVGVLNVPTARMAMDGTVVELVRYASHPDTRGENETNNTASWMLSRICRWAALEGFEQVRSMAGVAGNDGGIYQAANFEYDGEAESDPEKVAQRGNGRTAWTNATTLSRWIRDVHSGLPGVPRRVETRLDRGETGQVEQTALGEFVDYDPAAATTQAFELTREEISDDRYATDEEIPAFSPRVRDLFAHYGAGLDVLDTAEGRGQSKPAAVFGADVGGALAAALVVSGDPSRPGAEARVAGYAARGTKWPVNTGRWLLARATEWARLEGYAGMVVEGSAFSAATAKASDVAGGAGFESISTTNPAEATSPEYRKTLYLVTN